MKFTKEELGIILWHLEVLTTFNVPLSKTHTQLLDKMIERLKSEPIIIKFKKQVDLGNIKALEEEQ